MATLPPWIGTKFYLADGVTPNSGGKIFTYEPGTTTKKSTLQSESGSANTNPIICNSAGEVNMWLLPGGYKVVNAPANDTDPPASAIKTWDDINVAGGSGGEGQGFVASIAALRGLDEGAFSAVQVVGYNGYGTPGGGLFYWDSSTTAADNGGTIIAPAVSSGTGRWVRVLSNENEVNVSYFGAGDISPATDTDALVAAYGSFGGNPGTIVIDVELDLASTVTIPDNISIVVPQGGSFNIAAGQVLTIPQPEAGLYQIFYGAGAVAISKGAFVRVEWWGAKADDPTASSDAINKALAAFDRVKLSKGVYSLTGRLDLHTGNALTGEGKFLSTLKVAAGVSVGDMIRGDGVSDIEISGVGFDNYDNYPDDQTTGGNNQAYYLGDSVVSPLNYGIRFVNGGADITVRDCYFYGITGMSVNCEEVTAAPFYSKVRVINNTFLYGSYVRKVIQIAGGPTSGGEVESNCSTDILVSGNILNYNSAQIHPLPGIIYRVASCDGIHLDHCARFVISQNVVNYAAANGIRVEESLNGQVIGNVVSESGSDGIAVYADSQNISVTGNTVKGWGRTPVFDWMRKYDPGSGLKYYLVREYADPVTVLLPADPTSVSWIVENPYDLTGLDLSKVPTYDSGNYYAVSPSIPFTSLPDGGDINNPANFTVPSEMGMLPYRGGSGIMVGQRSRRVIVANNRLIGDVTQVGGKYTHASDFGISTVHPTNLPVAYDNPLIASGNIISGCILAEIYQPEYVDPVNARGAISSVLKYPDNYYITPGGKISELTGDRTLNIGALAGRLLQFISNGAVKYRLDDADLHTFLTAVVMNLTLQVKGNLTLGETTRATDLILKMNTATGLNRDIEIQNAGVTRMVFRLSTGDNFQLRMYDNAGAFIDNAISISRAAGGVMAIARPITTSGRVQMGQGADIAAANDLTLGQDGTSFKITGNTQVNGIATANWQAGSSGILLRFTGTPTIKHNTAPSAGFARIFLNGSVDLVATVNTILVLYYDGTQFHEQSRNVP